MAEVHFSAVSSSGPFADDKELIAMQGATAIVMQCIEKQPGMALVGDADVRDWDYEKIEKLVASTKKALIAGAE